MISIAPNTTCAIYRSGNAPPTAPDVAGVDGNLHPMPRNIKTQPAYTHWFDVPLATDIRSNDSIYVPDQNGTKFDVLQVQRIRPGGGNDFKRAYLNRQSVNWPSQNL